MSSQWRSRKKSRPQRPGGAGVGAKRDKAAYARAAKNGDEYAEGITAGRHVKSTATNLDNVIGDELTDGITRGGASSDLGVADSGQVLDLFEGYVDQIDGETAYVTLRTEAGEELHGEYSAAELEALGIHEHRRFVCETIEIGTSLRIEFKAISDIELSREFEDKVRSKVDELLADGVLDGDD